MKQTRTVTNRDPTTTNCHGANRNDTRHPCSRHPRPSTHPLTQHLCWEDLRALGLTYHKLLTPRSADGAPAGQAGQGDSPFPRVDGNISRARAGAGRWTTCDTNFGRTGRILRDSGAKYKTRRDLTIATPNLGNGNEKRGPHPKATRVHRRSRLSGPRRAGGG